jgi:CubicO group peptidase (beta-lactamase class C family)
MAVFIQTQLAGGVTADRKRIVSREQLARTWEPRMAVPPDPALPNLIASVTASYGLGWFAGEYLGQPILSHSGGIAGFISECVLLPESDVGVVVLTNGGAGARDFALAVPFRLFELLFDLPPQVEAILAQQEVVSPQAGPITPLATPDPAVFAPYLGQYANPRLGEATLRLTRDQLFFDASEVESEIRPGRGSGEIPDGFLFIDPPLSALPITLAFVEGPQGQHALELRVMGESAPRYVFRPV